MLVIVPQHQVFRLRRVSIQPGTSIQTTHPAEHAMQPLERAPLHNPRGPAHSKLGRVKGPVRRVSVAPSTSRKVRAHILTTTRTSASMSRPGNTPLSFPPANRAIFDAGNVCRRSGLDAMTPESIASVSLSGGGVVRVPNASTTPPPCDPPQCECQRCQLSRSSPSPSWPRTIE